MATPPALLELVSAQPEVASSVLYWLCVCEEARQGENAGLAGRVAIVDVARALCALRSTCTALARSWSDAAVLAELLSGRKRPADFTEKELGGFARQPWLPEWVDAAHGPRVPEDHVSISEGLSAAAAIVAHRSPADPRATATGGDGAPASSGHREETPVTVRLAAGSYTVTSPLDLPDGVRLVGSCAVGAAVIEVVGCIGVSSASRNSELVNLTFRARSSEASGTIADEEPGEDRAHEWGSRHCIYIRAGNLLLQDCDISCECGCGVAIVCDRDQEPPVELLEYPRLLRCTIHDGSDVGVYIESSSAELTDCIVKGHALSNIELLQSGSMTQLRGCSVEGGDEAGLHCCEGSVATLTECVVRDSGMAGLAAQEASNIRLCKCTIQGGWEGGVMAMGVGTAVVLDESTVSYNAEVGVEAKEHGRVVLHQSVVRSNGTAGVLTRLSGQAEIDDCQIFDNGLAGVEAREHGIAQLASCQLSGVIPVTQRHQTEDCSPQSLPAFLSSHDSVGSGIFVHRGGELHCTGCQIERHQGYGAKLSREGMLRITGCKLQRNRYGVAVDAQAALHVGQAIDMACFTPQPDWPHPPNHSYSCDSRDQKGAERWISPALSSSLSGVGSRTVTAFVEISDCTVQYNRQHPQLTWYGENGVLIIDSVRRDTNFGGGDVDAAVAVAAATLAREQRVDTCARQVVDRSRADTLDERLHPCLASGCGWAAVAQNDEPTGGQEGCDRRFETLVQMAGGPQNLQLPGDGDSEAWFATQGDQIDPSQIIATAQINILAPWAKVCIQIEGGTLRLLRAGSSVLGPENINDVHGLNCYVRDNVFALSLSECSVRIVRQLQATAVSDQASQQAPRARGIMLQDLHTLGRQCWLVVGDPEAWVAACQHFGAIVSTESSLS